LLLSAGKPAARHTQLVVCAGLSESAAARQMFFTGGGGASKMAAAAIGGEQKIQDFQPSFS